MKKIISLLLLVGAVSANAASLELIVKKQKTLPNGNAYGLESGIYFELTDLEPFVPTGDGDIHNIFFIFISSQNI